MLLDLLKKSRSIRSFQPADALSPSLLRELCDAARYAPAAMNLQPLKYRLVWEDQERARLLPLTRWAANLGISLPPKGHEPSGYIVICHDTSIAPEKPVFRIDVGIAAQTIMLTAAERGLGGCIIGSANAEEVAACLSLPAGLVPMLILALGVPDETVVLTEAVSGVGYYRDESNIHHVPKRPLDEIVL